MYQQVKVGVLLPAATLCTGPLMVVATNPAGLHRYNNHKVATMKVSMYVYN